MTKKNKESIIIKLKKELFDVVKTSFFNKSAKRVWFIKKGLC